MTPITRTRLGIALFVPLAAALLATFACLPAPVGDPETARLDDSLVGIWKGVPKTADNKDEGYALLRPWDNHTYLMRYFVAETKDGQEKRNALTYKAWLTPINNATFLTAQPMDDVHFGPAAAPDDKRYWVVFRVDRNADGSIDARMVAPDSDLIKEKTTRADIEAVIKAHLEEKSLYTSEPLTFKKLSKDDQLKFEENLKKFNVELP
jgi:hypothetical protein